MSATNGASRRPRSRRPPRRARSACGSRSPPEPPRARAPRRSRARCRGCRPSPARPVLRSRGPCPRHAIACAGEVGWARWPDGDLYEQIIAAADGHLRRPRGPARALHAKGAWCEGTFTATPRAGGALARLPSAGRAGRRPDPLLQRPRRSRGRTTPSARPRAGGQAARLGRRGDGHPRDHDSRASSPARPRTSSSCSRLRRPDPETGQPDFEKLGAWLGAHPEAQTAIQATLGAEPLASFATADLLLAAHLLARRRGRRADAGPLPLAPGRRASSASPTTRRRSAAATTCTTSSPSGLRAGPVAFELRLPAPDDDDPLDDPTALWPDDRELVDAGRLEIERSSTTPSATTTSTSSTRSGSSTGSSPPTTRSCTRAAGPTRSPPTGAGASRPGPSRRVSDCAETSALGPLRAHRRRRGRGAGGAGWRSCSARAAPTRPAR